MTQSENQELYLHTATSMGLQLSLAVDVSLKSFDTHCCVSDVNVRNPRHNTNTMCRVQPDTIQDIWSFIFSLSTSTVFQLLLDANVYLETRVTHHQLSYRGFADASGVAGNVTHFQLVFRGNRGRCLASPETAHLKPSASKVLNTIYATVKIDRLLPTVSCSFSYEYFSYSLDSIS